MSSPQEQYAEALRTSQDAVVQAMESWTKSAQSAFGQSPSTAMTAVEPSQVIDQVFDFAERMLEVQREFSKTLAATAVSAAEATRQQTEQFSDAARQQAESFGEAARSQAESAGGALREQAQGARTRKSTGSGASGGSGTSRKSASSGTARKSATSGTGKSASTSGSARKTTSRARKG